MKSVWSILVVIGAFAFIFSVATADAAGIRVKCEKRGGDRPERSRASVDAKNLIANDGPFTAMLTSGSNEATFQSQVAAGDEVEFDFDSDPENIAEGATAIEGSFIQGGQATGKVLDSDGMVILSDTVNCRIKN